MQAKHTVDLEVILLIGFSTATPGRRAPYPTVKHKDVTVAP